MQFAAAGHETAVRTLRCAPGLGVASTRQRRPSHRSASVTWTSEPLIRLPTAMQRAADAQDTPDRPLKASPGPGVRRTCQVLPFHCSASGSVAPSSVRYAPAAMQAVPVRQAMPGSDMTAVPGCASVSCVQVAPSHAMACEPETAMQLVALTQDTADRPPVPGVSTCCQVLPFQVRARLQVVMTWHGGFTSVNREPTAMQKVAARQDTPDNTLSAPGG